VGARPIAFDNGVLFPSVALSGTQLRDTNGWPRRATDRVAAYQPILSDYCVASGKQTNTVAMRAGHPFGNKVLSANLAFADGHVETHPRPSLMAVYSAVDSVFY